ncbi:Rha family transcriptional regulator [Gottfriedia acidiceleris]|uniref:Rha family transcriptional regulator n=1 Tax=Gottfriedia acidiceleris TaxID=371036 RepID=A0ABY4JQY2_9BACI|nr:Rha family transcriptional regulator [Gottfriedia acidiceleris]UPM55082.1 Rha family transcriptional regulator [Gottfriedia acidiceleris]
MQFFSVLLCFLTLHSANLPSENFFVSSECLNSRNQTQPCFLITKKGCDMVANKMNGEKGILFSVTNVEKFHDMENGVFSQVLTSGSPSASILMSAIGSKMLTILATESGKTQIIYEVAAVKTA